MNKREHGHRERGLRRNRNREVPRMWFAGIDIGGDRHVVAVVDGNGKTLVRAISFSEDAGGYARLRELLGKPGEGLVDDGSDRPLLAQSVRVRGNAGFRCGSAESIAYPPLC
jgi:hypothetical protein